MEAEFPPEPLCLYFRELVEAKPLLEDLISETRTHILRADEALDKINITIRAQSDEWLAGTYPDFAQLSNHVHFKLQAELAQHLTKVNANLKRLKLEVLDKLECLDQPVAISQVTDTSARLMRGRVESLARIRGLYRGASAAAFNISAALEAEDHSNEVDHDVDLIFGHREECTDDARTPSVGDSRIKAKSSNECKVAATRGLYQSLESWEEISKHLEAILFWTSTLPKKKESKPKTPTLQINITTSAQLQKKRLNQTAKN